MGEGEALEEDEFEDSKRECEALKEDELEDSKGECEAVEVEESPNVRVITGEEGREKTDTAFFFKAFFLELDNKGD